VTPPVIATQPLSQTGGYGDGTTLSVTATGTCPFSYQWQLNGANIPGATGSSLSLGSLQFNNAGLYSVIVSNAAGAVTSSVAVLNVASKLNSQLTSSGLILTWAGPFILQSANSPSGSYADVPGASSPYTNSLSSGQKYFRLRSQAFSLTSSNLPVGKFSVSGPGILGCNFVIQASTDMIHWQNLHTNPSPCLFVDDYAWQHPSRFYRAVLAH